MNKIKSIAILLVLLISIAPWGLMDICPSHPEGHEDVQHHGSCKDGMMDHEDEGKSDNSQSFFESISCTKISLATDEYHLSGQIKLPIADKFNIAAVLLNVLTWDVPEQRFYPLPDQQCNSDPPLGVNALRGPPLV